MERWLCHREGNAAVVDGIFSRIIRPQVLAFFANHCEMALEDTLVHIPRFTWRGESRNSRHRLTNTLPGRWPSPTEEELRLLVSAHLR